MNVIDFISNREKHIKETMANEGRNMDLFCADFW